MGLFRPAASSAKQRQQERPAADAIRAAAAAMQANAAPDHLLTDVEQEAREDLPALEAAEALAGAAAGSASAAGGAAGAAPVAARLVGSSSKPAAQPQQRRRQLKRERRLLDSPPAKQQPATSSSSSSVPPKQHKTGSHHHGPEADGCSVGGDGAPASDQQWLLPPPGWLPPFAADDRDRAWRGGRVAPLGANMLLLLYGRDGGDLSTSSSSSMDGDDGADDSRSSSSSSSSRSSALLEGLLVRLVYNEQVVPIPGCSDGAEGSYDCTLQRFLEVVVGDKTEAQRFERVCHGHGEADSDGSRSAALLGLSPGVVTADGLRLDLGKQQ
jgi:multiple inositol-polyphosphate phosphatase/2,3-bisphosphoglycerate 3-phosphatase